jgi:hypothetical protein
MKILGHHNISTDQRNEKIIKETQSNAYKQHNYNQDGYFHQLTIVDTFRIALPSKNSPHHYHRHTTLTGR